MYIQMTERCNMRCKHCCMDSSPKKGEHMNDDIFYYCIDIAFDYGECVALGGGEPTIHPHFFKLLDYASEKLSSEYLWMATNGKAKRKAKKLLYNYVMEGKIFVELSQDEFHEPIDDEIISLFNSLSKQNEYRKYIYAGIRNIQKYNYKVLPFGRAKKLPKHLLKDDKKEHYCCCAGLFIKPNGNMYLCGCEDSPCVGNIMNDYDVEKYFNFFSETDNHLGECWKTLNQKDVKKYFK